MDTALKQLVNGHPLLWRGRELSAAKAGIATGFPALDAALPEGGWPTGAIVEIAAPQWGSGELRLLLPALAAASRTRRLAWVAPPYIPYAPALAGAGIDVTSVVVISGRGSEILWAAEKLLESPACGAILAWPQTLRTLDVRRLQLAAQKGGGVGFLFRHRAGASSPAALRIALRTRGDRLQVQILKARGSCRHDRIDLKLL